MWEQAGRRAFKRALVVLGVWLALSPLSGWTQGLSPDTTLQAVRERLLYLGLENLLLDRNGDQFYVQYENRRYLHEIRAMGKVLGSLAPLLPPEATLHLYIQSYGITLAHVTVPMGAYAAFRAGTLNEADFSDRVGAEFPATPHLFPPDQPATNSLLGHSDLRLEPGYISTQAEGPTIVLSPTWTTYLNHGLVFSTGLRFPLWNTGKISSGFDFVSGDFSALVGGLPLATTARIGYSQGRFFLSNELAHELMGGVAELRLIMGVLHNTNPDRVLGWEGNILGAARWRFHPLDFILEVGGGRYLGFGAGATTGEWIRLIRYFGANDFALAFFRMHTAANPNGPAYQFNIEFRLSLGPEEGLRPGAVRVTWPPFFTGDLEAGWFIATQVTTNQSVGFLKRLYPAYIKTHTYFWREDL